MDPASGIQHGLICGPEPFGPAVVGSCGSF